MAGGCEVEEDRERLVGKWGRPLKELERLLLRLSISALGVMGQGAGRARDQPLTLVPLARRRRRMRLAGATFRRGFSISWSNCPGLMMGNSESSVLEVFSVLLWGKLGGGDGEGVVGDGQVLEEAP